MNAYMVWTLSFDLFCFNVFALWCKETGRKQSIGTVQYTFGSAETCPPQGTGLEPGREGEPRFLFNTQMRLKVKS